MTLSGDYWRGSLHCVAFVGPGPGAWVPWDQKHEAAAVEPATLATLQSKMKCYYL